MMTFAARRWIGVVVLAAASAIALAAWLVASAALVRHVAVVSGFSLLAVCLLLTLFNARKKIPWIPALSGAAWLQFHVYAGLFSIVLFLIHISFRFPGGAFELGLAALFVGVALSGLFGLYISRRLPKRLTRRGENVLFERIPALRKRVIERAEEVVARGVVDSGARSVADFYESDLRPWFARPRGMVEHLANSNAPRHRVLNRIDAFKNYVSPTEAGILDELRELAIQKDDLDYQHAGQSLLKGWLFVHIPLTYGLLVFVAVHVALVFVFEPEVLPL
jgi:hypothetical protein